MVKFHFFRRKWWNVTSIPEEQTYIYICMCYVFLNWFVFVCQKPWKLKKHHIRSGAKTTKKIFFSDFTKIHGFGPRCAFVCKYQNCDYFFWKDQFQKTKLIYMLYFSQLVCIVPSNWKNTKNADLDSKKKLKCPHETTKILVGDLR